MEGGSFDLDLEMQMEADAAEAADETSTPWVGVFPAREHRKLRQYQWAEAVAKGFAPRIDELLDAWAPMPADLADGLEPAIWMESTRRWAGAEPWDWKGWLRSVEQMGPPAGWAFSQDDWNQLPQGWRLWPRYGVPWREDVPATPGAAWAEEWPLPVGRSSLPEWSRRTYPDQAGCMVDLRARELPPRVPPDAWLGLCVARASDDGRSVWILGTIAPEWDVSIDGWRFGEGSVSLPYPSPTKVARRIAHDLREW